MRPASQNSLLTPRGLLLSSATVVVVNTVIALVLWGTGNGSLSQQMVYSQTIGISIWVMINGGSVWLVRPHDSGGFPRGWRAVVLVIGASTLGIFLGNLVGDWYSGVATLESALSNPRRFWVLLVMTIGVGAIMTAYFSYRSKSHNLQGTLDAMALHDQLTGLANRFALEARLEQSMALARSNGVQLALLLLDLDRFKTINDTLGHAAGDEFLKVIAGRLSACVRDVDTVARLWSDKFVVVINEVRQASDVAEIAQKLIDTVCAPVCLAHENFSATVSLGISLFPDDGSDHSTLTKNADRAMNHAKTVGRNRFQFFTDSMNEAVNAQLKLETDLRYAIEKDELLLYFQPQMSGQTGQLTGFEALIRWQPKGRPVVYPDAFIGLAEQTGLIVPMGAWVLNKACATLHEWRTMGWHDIRMAINLSALQLKDTTLPHFVAQLLQRYHLPPEFIELEVTESVAMDDPKISIANLQALKALGVSLAVDDFGTGYSSLAYLKLFPIDRLKLDRTFVSDIGVNANGDVICSATITLAHNLRLELVAEGVETTAQRDFLATHGCDTLQGYLFGKPMPADAALAYLQATSPLQPSLP